MSYQEIDHILDKAILENQWHFLVTWKHLKDPPTWLSATRLAGHADIVHSFKFLSSPTIYFELSSEEESRIPLQGTYMALIEACFEEHECKTRYQI
jgi:hypothetical protein